MKCWGSLKKVEPWYGPVKSRPDLVGEVRNLKDPAAQRRSIAAILAKKCAQDKSRINLISGASMYRELTEKECEAVFEAVGWKHGQGQR